MTYCHIMTYCLIHMTLCQLINKLTLTIFRNIILIHNDNNNVNS